MNLTYMSGGMEVTLAVPLLFALCSYRLNNFAWRPRSGLIYGSLCTALVLARLDSALFVLLLAPLDLLLSSDHSWKDRARTAVPFVIGMLPVLLYLVWNVYAFGTAMPISSHAKEMRFHHGFSIAPFHALRVWFLDESKTLIHPVCFALAICVITLIWRGWGRLRSDRRGLITALLLFMPLHLAILSFSSDWPIWQWYLYPFLACALGTAIVLLTREERFFTDRYFLTGLLAAFICLSSAVFLLDVNTKTSANLNNGKYSFYFSAQDIAAFARAHPGIYAMGDRAGVVGYYLPAPLVQTEGLMMDKPFLENIKQQRDLLTVLRGYKVRYFIATNPVAAGNCLAVREPAQAGPDAPVMRGTFCSKPVHTFLSSDHYKAVIFDMQNE